MIINFNKYLLFEKSFLNKFSVSNNIIKFLYDIFIFKHNDKFTKIETNDLYNYIKNLIIKETYIIFCKKEDSYYFIFNKKISFSVRENSYYSTNDDEDKFEDEEEFNNKISLDEYNKKNVEKVRKFFKNKIKELSTYKEKISEYEDFDNLWCDLDEGKMLSDDELYDLLSNMGDEEEYEDDYGNQYTRTYKRKNDNSLLVHTIDNKDIFKTNVKLKDFLKNKKDYTFYYLNVAIKDNKNYSLSIIDIKKAFENTYSDIFRKIIEKYFNNLKEYLFKNLNYLKLNKSDLLHYNNLLNNDLITLHKIMNNFHNYYANLIKFSDELKIDLKDLNEKNINYFIKYMCYSIYNRINSELNFKNQEKMSLLLEKDPSLWKNFKNNIYDKELKDKWQHLDYADNFDLI